MKIVLVSLLWMSYSCTLTGGFSDFDDAVQRMKDAQAAENALNRNFLKLEIGMNKPKVENLVGKPENINFKKNVEVYYYNEITPPRILKFKSGKLTSMKNNFKEIKRRQQERNLRRQEEIAEKSDVSLLECEEENIHGKFSRGGGCNMHGCWPKGGSCSMHGCSMSSTSCSIMKCPDKQETFRCR